MELIINCETQAIETVTPARPPLADRKKRLWESVKQTREVKIGGGVNVPGIGLFQTDDRSRDNIAGAATASLIAQAANAPFSLQWTLADNTVVTLSAAQVQAVGMAVMSHVAACHAVGQTLRGQIDAATTHAALDSINIPGANWP